jgi:hypothetical protein
MVPTFTRSRCGFTMLPLILFLFVIVGLLSAGYMMLGPKVQLCLPLLGAD